MDNVTTPCYSESTYITKTKYTIAKKEFEFAGTYLSDTYQYAPKILHPKINEVQEMLARLSQVMQNMIDIIENSGQPEKK